jgi:Carbohydrate binding domain/Metallo-peptidase family M12B Reprolysin-like
MKSSGMKSSGMKSSKDSFILSRTFSVSALLSICASVFSVSVCAADYVIDIKPVYTAEFEQASGGNAQMMSKMQVSFAKINEAFVNSPLPIKANMVYPQKIALPPIKGFTDIGGLQNYLKGQQVWRDYVAQGADFMHYFEYAPGSGLAYVNGEFGMSGSVGDNVFRHEMGHNMGCNHSDGFQSATGNTIMNGNQLPWYSNPAHIVSGIAQGDATHNCTGIISRNANGFSNRRQLVGGPSSTANSSSSKSSAPLSSKSSSSSSSVINTGNNLAQNAGFESGALGAWTKWNDTSVVANNARSGSYALRLNGLYADSRQTITVKPNTNYVLTAYMKSSQAEPMYMGLKGFSGGAKDTSVSSTNYTLAQLIFKTGAQETQITMYLYHHGPSNGTGYVDDVSLTELRSAGVKIEAESATVFGNTHTYRDSAASNATALGWIDGIGNGFILNNVPAANSFTIRYSSAYSGSSSYYVNGVKKGNINFTSTGAFRGSYSSLTVTEAIPAGAQFKIQYEQGNRAWNVDFITFIP